MKKIFKILALPVMVMPSLLITSCNNCSHEASDELVSLYAGDRVGAMYKCKHCNEAVYVAENPTEQKINMPVIKLNGDFSQMSKESKVKLTCIYNDPKNPEKKFSFDNCDVKWQGNSSIEYPKKNFSINLGKKNKVQLLDDYKATQKYAFKANYCDSSNIRNIMLSEIAETVYASETGLDDCYSKLPHYGLVSGYQAALYCNDVYWGTYNVSTKKDVEMWTTNDEKTLIPKAIVVGDDYTKSTMLQEPIASDFSNGWELEEPGSPTEETQAKIVESFNKFIKFVNETSVDEFASKIDTYSSKTRLIDYIIMLQAFALDDNWAKNIIWVTYDYEKWYPFLYDMDLTLGIDYYTLPVFPDAKFDWFKKNALFNKIWRSCFNEIKTKYESLRQTVLSNDAMKAMVDKYFDQGKTAAIKGNKQRWSSAPYSGAESTSEFIKYWITTRLNWLDTHFDEN